MCGLGQFFHRLKTGHGANFCQPVQSRIRPKMYTKKHHKMTITAPDEWIDKFKDVVFLSLFSCLCFVLLYVSVGHIRVVRLTFGKKEKSKQLLSVAQRLNGSMAEWKHFRWNPTQVLHKSYASRRRLGENLENHSV